MSDLITADEAATLLGVKRNSIYSLVKAGLLRGIHKPESQKWVRFERAEVLAYRARQEERRARPRSTNRERVSRYYYNVRKPKTQAAPPAAPPPSDTSKAS